MILAFAETRQIRDKVPHSHCECSANKGYNYENLTRKSGFAEHFLEFKERAAFYFQKGNAAASGAIDRCGDAAEAMGETAR
jgi:hypothetical protein